LNGSRRYSLDTSFLTYHYYNRETKTSRILSSGALNLTTVSETLYVLCRTEGLEKSLQFIKDVYKQAQLVPSERLVAVAGQFKCKYPISLADSWVLATGKILRIPALFAHREEEIINHLESISKEVEVAFLDEVPLTRGGPGRVE